MMVTTPAATHSATANPPSAGANRPSMTANQSSATANHPFHAPQPALYGSRQNGLVWGYDQKKCNLVLYFTRFALPL